MDYLQSMGGRKIDHLLHDERITCVLVAPVPRKIDRSSNIPEVEATHLVTFTACASLPSHDTSERIA
jgi:hypothetical protein